MKRALALLAGAVWMLASFAWAGPSALEKAEGLLIGSMIGDAAGGPTEFQAPARMIWSLEDRALTAERIREIAAYFYLRPYGKSPSPYAQWVEGAAVGQVTDDTRHKLILIQSLERAGKPDPRALAEEVVRYWNEADRFQSLRGAWLSEYGRAALWELGASDTNGALPPDRLWGGIATDYGEMTFLPMAIVHAGDAERAYRAVWDLDFMETGSGKDISSAVVAGLAAALGPGGDFGTIEKAMRATDPFHFSQVPWVPRELDSWLDLSHQFVARSGRVPARLFHLLETELHARVWWESWAQLVIALSIGELTGYDPLASLELNIEFGHDTDSCGQLLGAMMGAVYGSGAFPAALRDPVLSRLRSDYGTDFGHLMQVLRMVRSNSR